MNTIRVYQNEYEASYQFKIEVVATELVEKAIINIERLSNEGWAYGIGDLLEQNSNLEAKVLESLKGWEKGWEISEQDLITLGNSLPLLIKALRII